MQDQMKHYIDKLTYEMDSADVDTAIKNGSNVVVIDARGPAAFETEHIPGAINIPHRTMNDETTQYISKDALVITYCDGIGCNA